MKRECPLWSSLFFPRTLADEPAVRDHYPSNVQFGLEMKWRTGQDANPCPLSRNQKMSIAWRPCPARGQGRASRQDEARVLSSVRAETALGCADGNAFAASFCGREVIFHRIFATRRSCLQTTALSPGHKKSHLKSEARGGQGHESS